RALDTGLLHAARRGLIDALRLDELDQTELNRIVAVRGRRLALHHHARPGLEQSNRHHLSIRPEHLRHSNLLAKNSWSHKNKLSAFSVQLSATTSSRPG